MAIISIDYDEPKPETYRGVEISTRDNKDKRFDSGDFIKDWFNVIKYTNTEIEDGYVMYSSSVDHFIMDGAPFDSKYLIMVDDKPVLVTPAISNEGLELFVKEQENPTWEELKEYCKNVK